VHNSYKPAIIRLEFNLSFLNGFSKHGYNISIPILSFLYMYMNVVEFCSATLLLLMKD
jgi:hypothetical protein